MEKEISFFTRYALYSVVVRSIENTGFILYMEASQEEARQLKERFPFIKTVAPYDDDKDFVLIFYPKNTTGDIADQIRAERFV